MSGILEMIRSSHAESGRRFAVVDDDPTGSQTVHGASVVLGVDTDQIAAGLSEPGAICFILTNSRSLNSEQAREANQLAGRAISDVAKRLGAPVTVVSRSDSTLRGHLMAEIEALDEARREAEGSSYDGVLLASQYFEAGRHTAEDVHWARVSGDVVPVAETEFAADATFGFSHSNLPAWIQEKSDGRIDADEITSIGLDDIRIGGPRRVTEILSEATERRFIVINGTGYADLETVALGVLEAEAAGMTFLFRTGPSMVGVLAGQEPIAPLSPADSIRSRSEASHGLIVVGSHVGLTTRQVEVALAEPGLEQITIEVPKLLDDDSRDEHTIDVIERAQQALSAGDVLLATSRQVIVGESEEVSLALSGRVSRTVVEIVRALLSGQPSWVIAKGGITSNDIATQALGVRRAEVVGQLLPGMVSVWRLIDAAKEAIGMSYVVFAGNVGDETTLAEAIRLMRAGVR